MINKLIIDTLKPLNIPISYQKYTGSADTYITFFYYLTQGEDFSDDEEETTGYYVQIDLFYKSDIGDLQKQIINLLEQQEFKKINIRDLPPQMETDVYHTVISVFYLE